MKGERKRPAQNTHWADYLFAISNCWIASLLRVQTSTLPAFLGATLMFSAQQTNSEALREIKDGDCDQNTNPDPDRVWVRVRDRHRNQSRNWNHNWAKAETRKTNQTRRRTITDIDRSNLLFLVVSPTVAPQTITRANCRSVVAVRWLQLIYLQHRCYWCRKDRWQLFEFTLKRDRNGNWNWNWNLNCLCKACCCRCFFGLYRLPFALNKQRQFSSHCQSEATLVCLLFAEYM